MSTANTDMRDAFFDEVYNIAAKDKNVVFLTADHAAFSLIKYQKDFPKQYYNVGIAEQNMISLAAGLALSGKKVFAYSINNFTSLRCIEQISVDVCSMNLDVTIVGVGAGFTYSTDGPTHHGTQDMAALSSIPRLTILNCSDACNTGKFAHLAYQQPGPKYVRIEKGTFPDLYSSLNHDFSRGLCRLSDGKDITLVTTGMMVHRANEVAVELKKNGLSVAVVDLYCVKPVNAELLLEELKKSQRVVTIEENMATGSMGSVISTVFTDNAISQPLLRISLKDQFHFKYGDRDYLHEEFGLDKASIVKRIQQWLK